MAALGRALSGADDMCRRKCAEGLRSVRFAETTALAILADEAKTKPLLKRAVLGLALWQHAWVDRHLAKLVEATRQESANDHSDDEDPLGSFLRKKTGKEPSGPEKLEDTAEGVVFGPARPPKPPSKSKE